MRPRRVTLLDIGLDSSFDAAMTFVQSTLQNVNAGLPQPIVEIDFVRSRDPDTVLSAFTSSCDVLHVMAHGDHSVTPAFTSSDGKVSISFAELGKVAAGKGSGISAGAVIADGCKTGTGVWQKAVRDCLQGEVTYIGTSAMVGWHDSGVFSSAFYGSLLRNKGVGVAPSDQAEDAAQRAIEAFTMLTDRKCPFKVKTLQPSQLARRSLG